MNLVHIQLTIFAHRPIVSGLTLAVVAVLVITNFTDGIVLARIPMTQFGWKQLMTIDELASMNRFTCFNE